MDPYTKPNERKIGVKRPKVLHLSPAIDPRTRKERLKEKQALIDERRALKKAARQNLQRQLRDDLGDL